MTTKPQTVIGPDRVRLVRHSDPANIRVYNFNRTRRGIMVAQYDQYIWVLWDDAGEIKGCWQPDTVRRTDVWTEGLSCRS